MGTGLQCSSNKSIVFLEERYTFVKYEYSTLYFNPGESEPLAQPVKSAESTGFPEVASAVLPRTSVCQVLVVVTSHTVTVLVPKPVSSLVTLGLKEGSSGLKT
jgi:hypothetical protein